MEAVLGNGGIPGRSPKASYRSRSCRVSQEISCIQVPERFRSNPEFFLGQFWIHTLFCWPSMVRAWSKQGSNEHYFRDPRFGAATGVCKYCYHQWFIRVQNNQINWEPYVRFGSTMIRRLPFFLSALPKSTDPHPLRQLSYRRHPAHTVHCHHRTDLVLSS